MTPPEFCISQSVRMARECLSYNDCLPYLRGLLILAGDRPEAAALRETVVKMDHNDQQLELIAEGPDIIGKDDAQ